MPLSLPQSSVVPEATQTSLDQVRTDMMEKLWRIQLYPPKHHCCTPSVFHPRAEVAGGCCRSWIGEHSRVSCCWTAPPGLELNTGGGGRGLVVKSCLTLVTPWTAAHQPPLSIRFSRQKYWNGLPFSSPWDLPDPGIEPGSPLLQAVSFIISRFFTDWAIKEAWSLIP